ncbi:MAG: ImmA/IrrE family metallo-endopeptidase [Rhizobiaceae bacterium]
MQADFFATGASKVVSEPRPVPSRVSREHINSFAEQLAASLDFGPGDSIEPLVKKLGGKIAYKNPVEYKSRLPESIIIRKMDDFTIFLPSMTSPERDRFTIAHELGHLMLHYPLVLRNHRNAVMAATRWVDETDQDQQRAEWEANWFAAGFLMPCKPFSKAYRDAKGNLSMVALKFGVSQPAAEVRAKSLHLK